MDILILNPSTVKVLVTVGIIAPVPVTRVFVINGRIHILRPGTHTIIKVTPFIAEIIY